MTTLRIGLVSVSDRASQGVYQDKGIPALTEWLSLALTSPFTLESRVIPDEQLLIEQTLTDWSMNIIAIWCLPPAVLARHYVMLLRMPHWRWLTV